MDISKKEESSRTVSRVLCPSPNTNQKDVVARASVIHLVSALPLESSVLPSDLDEPPSHAHTALLPTRTLSVYMNLQLPAMHSHDVTTVLVGSCPTFSPLPQNHHYVLCVAKTRKVRECGGSFLLHCSTFARTSHYEGGCPALPGLSSPRKTTRTETKVSSA